MRMSVSEFVSLPRWLFTWRHRSQVSTLTDPRTHTAALRFSDVLPLGPLITCGRGRAAGGRGAIEAGRAQHRSKGSSFTGAECDVVKWDQAAYLTHAPSHSSSPSRQSPTHLFFQSISHSFTYLKTLRSLHCVTTQTSKSIKQSVKVTLPTRQKTGLCLISSFVDVEQLVKLKFVNITHQPVSLAIKAGWVMCVQCVDTHIHTS